MSGTARWSARFPLTLGAAALALLLGGFGLWSVEARIAGAIIASGRVEVEQNRQAVQHPDGGMVAEVLVAEGGNVAAGAALIRLDPSLLESERAIVEAQLLELLARDARLLAERDDAAALAPDGELVAAALADADPREMLQGQERLFAARRESLARQISQLRQRQGQIARQIEGIAAQQAALDTQLALIGEELSAQKDLLAKGLAQVGRVLALQREEARLAGEIGDLLAREAEARERASEIDTQILSLESTRREEAISELRDLRARLFELRERRRALDARLSRLEIRAPVAGAVHGLAVFGPGAVVRAAEPVLAIVPGDRPLVVTARVFATDIDSVHGGQEARLRFPAFDARETPDVPGAVVKISADAFTDESTGTSFYRVEVAPDPAAMTALGGVTLLPGMPVEVYLRTAERSPLGYLVKPLADYFNRAFRDG
ncbi:MAG: HlyD family type I secretion periplasmic adaptor subunit [Alphaproteobacteria bacterium HGW-Alphaproteobacteria-2]|nr:MAG: HlyD family type I secretion periplasmic adaptor subunit [Alphaproteobacteria bacterium HGW-Alphaproteobacteria-2]